MSGGSMNYVYSTLEYEAVGNMGDREIDDLMKDVVKLLKDREWCLSGDTCDETYIESVKKFKHKWFKTPRKERLKKYINQMFDKTRTECMNLIGCESVFNPAIDFDNHPYIVKYGEFVDKTTAAKLLDVTRATVYAMLKDGRISAAHGGSRVSVRSIVNYINSNGGKYGKAEF